MTAGSTPGRPELDDVDVILITWCADRGLVPLADTQTGNSVVLELFDLRGRRLVHRSRVWNVPGRREVTWNGQDDTGRTPAAGVYFLRLEVGGNVETRRVVLLP